MLIPVRLLRLRHRVWSAMICGLLEQAGRGCIVCFEARAIFKKNPCGCGIPHGYMHHGGEWFERLPYVYAGNAVLVMEARGQGGLSEDVYAGAGPTLFGHVVRGVRDKDPHKLYYRDVYLDAAKAVRILMSMDFVDEARVATIREISGRRIGV